MSRLIAFGWYGGKYSHLDWLLPLLPKTTHFCEPFGGSASVLINREPSPVETYNDLDEELVNFFQVLRDQQTKLIQAIAFTPFSKREFELAISQPEIAISNLERARRFYIRARQVRTGLAQTASSGRWAHCKLTSRAGMAGAVSRWLGSIEDLSLIVQRLQRVQIEYSPALDVIKRYDSPETLFYCDPPYPHESRGDNKAYGYEMSDEDHFQLASILHHVEGKVAISGYDSPLMNELYGDWQRFSAPSKQCHSVKKLRTEVLWMNYDLKNYSVSMKPSRLKKLDSVIMTTPLDILNSAFDRAFESFQSGIALMIPPEVAEKIEYVCRLTSNKSGIRFILATNLAKSDDPKLDIRKPFSKELKENDAYSGRGYDENFVAIFLNNVDLQEVCNTTTAFLTPAYRTKGIALTLDTEIVGRPSKLYKTLLELLNDVYTEKIRSEDVLAETIKQLLIIRNERRQRIQSLLANLSVLDEEDTPLSAEAIVKLIRQHLDSPRSSRLPVLVVAAVYQAACNYLGERCLSLESHNAADKQTGSIGDLEITLLNDNNVITSYEIKKRKVTILDINNAIQKINQRLANTGSKIDNYIFITTETIDRDVQEYAASLYERTGGIEIVVLDCLSFLRHFLHLFHRLRGQFLEEYQQLLLQESESFVPHVLKETFLTLRQAAESGSSVIEENTELDNG